MKPLVAAEILNLYEYEKVREARRREVIALKSERRVEVGRYLSFVFENRETVWFQIQEMVRAERIVDDAALAGQLAAKTGLSGSASHAVATDHDAVRVNRGAKKAGVLVEVRVTPLDHLPFDDGAFDLVVIHSASGQLASAAAEERVRDGYSLESLITLAMFVEGALTDTAELAFEGDADQKQEARQIIRTLGATAEQVLDPMIAEQGA